ncbi:MAG: response regulator transcription factor [Treponema sp.]|jgi:DNA-binding response OmpR family regulator|nr:response regulator transcription factor [Treponema sp.]
MADTKQSILIIEDNSDIASLEKDFLEINGFDVVIESDGLTGAERALSGGFSLILLDLMLPGKDGMMVCREIRNKIDVPILMVTARVEDTDKVRGLGLGADDYISKPFSPVELVARVKSHIARYRRILESARSGPQGDAPEKFDTIDFGWLKINKTTRRVFARAKEITLTRKEYDLVCLLAGSPEQVFSKEQLYNAVWGEDVYGDLKTVAVHINRLREKIEQDGARIQTVYGGGYRFTG